MLILYSEAFLLGWRPLPRADSQGLWEGTGWGGASRLCSQGAGANWQLTGLSGTGAALV